MRKPSQKTLKRKCMALWQEIVKEKAGNKCEVCGKSGGVIASHHIIGRKNLTLRYDIKNGCSLCYQHHVGGNQSAHNDPLWFQRWLIDNRFSDFKYLSIKRMELSTKIDYEEVLEILKGMSV